MAHIAVVFGSTDGQTAKIARHIANELRSEHEAVTVIDTRIPQAPEVLAGVEAVVIAGSMRLTRFQHTLVAFVRAHHEKLSLMPNALVAVSLFGTRQSGIGRWELQRSVERFIEDTGFLPSDVRPIAGALRYSHYGFSGRMAMAVVSKLAGGDLDTSRDCEYTDWKAVTEFAAHFAARALAELHPHPVKLPVEPAIHV
jgi:menaquinone-dependent protoporphyrinogen oxidase